MAFFGARPLAGQPTGLPYFATHTIAPLLAFSQP